MKSHKIPPPNLGWAPSTIRAILARELYHGEVVWNRSQKRDNWGQVVVETSPHTRGRLKEYICHRHRVGHRCTNDRCVSMDALNEAVLAAIEPHALIPEAIAQVIALPRWWPDHAPRSASHRDPAGCRPVAPQGP